MLAIIIVKKVAVSAPPGLAPSRSGKAPFAAFPSSIRTGSLPFTSISGSSPSTPSLASPCAFWLSPFQGLGDSPVLSRAPSLRPRPFALGPRRLVQFRSFALAGALAGWRHSTLGFIVHDYDSTVLLPLCVGIGETFNACYSSSNCPFLSLLLGLRTYTANHHSSLPLFCHVSYPGLL